MVRIDIKKDLKQRIARAVMNAHREIVMNTPVRTGRLRQSIIIEETSNGWIIGTNMPYAPFIELGVKPHEIKPRNKKALRFIEKGQEVIVKKVMHPGFEGSHMFLKGLRILEKELDKELKK